jgi:hypothetical protein
MIITVKRIPSSTTETSHFEIYNDGVKDRDEQIEGRKDAKAAFLRVTEYVLKVHDARLRYAGRDDAKRMQWTSELSATKEPKVTTALLKKGIKAAGQPGATLNRSNPHIL